MKNSSKTVYRGSQKQNDQKSSIDFTILCHYCHLIFWLILLVLIVENCHNNGTLAHFLLESAWWCWQCRRIESIPKCFNVLFGNSPDLCNFIINYLFIAERNINVWTVMLWMLISKLEELKCYHLKKTVGSQTMTFELLKMSLIKSNYVSISLKYSSKYELHWIDCSPVCTQCPNNTEQQICHDNQQILFMLRGKQMCYSKHQTTKLKKL